MTYLFEKPLGPFTQTVPSSMGVAGGARYFPYIDGLRALAVLSVFVFHLNGLLPGGFVGVDVFFVISGFVVSMSLARFEGKGFWQFLGHFYVRRLQRIAPALIVCLLVTALASALFIPQVWLSIVNYKTGLYAFFGLSNIPLVESGRDYFAPTTDFNPYTHTWSLAVEEQFYVLFPLLFFAWAIGGRGRRLSVLLFASAFAASLGFGGWESQARPISAYFMTPSRFWELAAGVLLYQLTHGDAALAIRLSGRWREIIGWLSLATLLAAFVLSSKKGFPVPGALPAVIGTLGVIWALHGHSEARRLHDLLGCKPLVFVGKISYSLYLWHWPVFVLFRWTCGLETPLTQGVATVLAFSLAVISWRWVENPVRRAGFMRHYPQGAVIAGSLLVVFLGALMARGIGANQRTLSLSTVTQNAVDWYPFLPVTSSEHPGCIADFQRVKLDGTQLAVYTPTGCREERPLKEGTVYVIGDSHAFAYEGLFKQYAIREARRVAIYSSGGCPFVSLQPRRDFHKGGCRPYADAILRDMRTRLKAGDVLFLPSLRLARFADQWIFFGEKSAEQQMFDRRAEVGRRAAIAEAIKILREFGDRGVQIVFEAPKPIFKVPLFRCADWFNRSNPICAPGFVMERAYLDRFRAPILQSFAAIAQRVPGVSVWDPYPILCPETQCSLWRDGKPLFLDGDHISGYGNSVVLPSFTAAMEARLGP